MEKTKLASNISSISSVKPATKLERVLESLIQGPITRFDAEQIGCHCLNSSASTLTHHYGLTIARRPVKRSGRFGAIRCNEYWISAGEIEAAYKLLNQFRKKRGAQGINLQAA